MIIEWIKSLLRNLLWKTYLSHVSAHKRMPENETADMLAKQATARPSVHFSLPVPHSHIKKHLRANFMKQWQDYWDYSDKGRYTYNLVPAVSLDLLLVTPSTTAFLTGHSHFGVYLFMFKRALSPLCECGEDAVASHYFYNCPLTARWHIRRPPVFPDGWLANILSRPILLSKLKTGKRFPTLHTSKILEKMLFPLIGTFL